MSLGFRLGSAVIELSTSDKKLAEGLAAAKKKVTTAAGEIQQQADFSASLGKFFTGAAVGKSVALLGDMVRQSRAEEVGITRLSTAVDNAGLSWKEHGAQIEKIIQARQRLAYSDGTLRDSLSILVAQTGSVTDALKLQLLAADLARGKNIDLATASEIVGKVAQGNVSILTRYGIVLKEGATAQEALAALQARFGGQAEAYANTAQGSADKLATAWGNAMETVGGAVDGVLPIVANAATTWSGFGHEGILAAGAIATFAKAGQGTTPVLSGLRSGITALGGALKLLFLNPIGIAILAVAALAIGLKLLYDRSEGFRRIVNAVGDALRRVFGPILGWLGDRLGDLGKALGLVGDDAEQHLGEDFADGAAKAKSAIKSIGDEVKDLNEMFKPAGADQTEKFLQAIGADPALISAALDALYNTVGADQATRFRKVTDRAFKDLSTQFASSDAYKEAKENLKNALSMSNVDFGKLAASLGKSPAQYMAELKANSADADKLLEHYQAQLEAAIAKARENGQTELQLAKDAAGRVSDHIRALNDVRVAWNEADSAARAYYLGVLRGVPRQTPISPANRELQNGGALSGGGLSVVVNQSLAYSGDTATMAAGAAGEVVDAVTEAMRQQLRRLA